MIRNYSPRSLSYETAFLNLGAVFSCLTLVTDGIIAKPLRTEGARSSPLFV